METAYIGLGANLGDAQATLMAACRAVAAVPGVRGVVRSSCYRSAPVQAQGPDYVNAVARLETDLEPRQLLEALQAIEQRHGRERPYRNAPRTLDLDLLLYGERHIDQPGLQVPHPRMGQRAFVLLPLLELLPGLRLPGEDDVAQLAARLAAEQGIERIDGTGAPADAGPGGGAGR